MWLFGVTPMWLFGDCCEKFLFLFLPYSECLD
jgi:hypothetical protein